MKGIIRILAVLLFFVFIAPGYCEEVINIATEDYPPHTSPNLKHYGLNCYIVTEAFALEGIKVNYKFYPGKRAYVMTQRGEVDAAVPWVWREDREEFFYFTDPVCTAGRDSFFHLKTLDFKWNSEKPDYKALKGLRVGAIRGHNYGKEFQDAEKSGLIQVDRLPTMIQNFKKLYAGRIQVYYVEHLVGYYELQTNFSRKNVDLLTHTWGNDRPAGNYHLIISKKSKKGKYFLKAFNEGLKKLKKSGRYDQYVKESLQGDYIIKK